MNVKTWLAGSVAFNLALTFTEFACACLSTSWRAFSENTPLEVEIRAAHKCTNETCGPQRLQSDPADHGIQVGLDRIKRIRKKLGLRCKQQLKFKATTASRHHLAAAPNLLDRNFTVSAPKRVWVSDIKYIPNDEGRL
jgi:putative transposase